MKKLSVGDNVMWRGAWGNNPPIEATIESLELCAVGSKHGYKQVYTAQWSTVKAQKVIISLTNGHWCYGNQIEPLIK